MSSDIDPYRLLGISPHASENDKKSAYRNALRRSHPDTGGSAEEFAAVQRAWELISKEPTAPTGSSRVPPKTASSGWMPTPESPGSTAQVGARSYGHPGGWFREKYVAEIREWIGRGSDPGNVFAPELVERAPRHIQHTLAAALAEEKTAVALSALGPGNTIWHDVVVSGDRVHGAIKIDHVAVVGSLLWAIQSEDWASSVRVSRGELVGEGIGVRERPAKDLVAWTRKLGKNLGVRFSGCIVVVDDTYVESPRQEITTRGRMPCYLIAQTHVVDFLTEQSHTTPSRTLVGDDMFPVREKLQAGIRFV